MRRTRVIVAAVVGVASAGVLSDVAEAATLTVGVSPGCATIQACVDTASPGDTIRIRVGEYQENVVVDKALIITGYGPRSRRCAPERVIVDAEPGGVAGVGFDVVADGVTVRCLTVRNGLHGVRVGLAAVDEVPAVPVDGFTLERVRALGSEEPNVTIVGDGFRVLDSTSLGTAEDNDGGIVVDGAWGLVEGNHSGQSNRDCYTLDVSDSEIRNNTGGICDSVGINVEGSGNEIVDNALDNIRNEGYIVDGDDNLVQANSYNNVAQDAFQVTATRTWWSATASRTPEETRSSSSAWRGAPADDSRTTLRSATAPTATASTCAWRALARDIR